MSVGQISSPIIAFMRDDLPLLNSPQNKIDVELSILSMALFIFSITARLPYC